LSTSPAADPRRALQEDLLARLRAVVANNRDAVELQVECSHLLAELKQPKEAARLYREAVKSRAPKYPLTTRAYSVLPYRGAAVPITAVLLVSPEWGNAPFRKYLDDQVFLTLQVIADFQDPRLALPPHQLVINCISDADACASSLQAASALLAGSAAPVINPPAHVMRTSRESGARRLEAIPGVRTAKIATFSREQLVGDRAGEILAQAGFSFPLLLRSPGFHTGLHFARVESPQELGAALPSLPGDSLSVIEFLEARGADGHSRKYRVMMIDGKLYPAHLAISRDWKVHYFSAAMADFPEHRAEDKAFLEDMPGVLGARVMESLRQIQELLKLDYAGMDFSVGSDGEILLFEANATMQVGAPDADAIWDYRRGAVRRIEDAVRALLLNRATSPTNSGAGTPPHALRETELQNLEERLQREPELTELQLARARLLIELERYDEAKQVYLGILVKAPAHVVALNNFAALLHLMGSHDTGLKLNRAVLALEPDNFKARLNLAENLRKSGELAEARDQYEIILQLAPDLQEAHLGLAYVLRYLRQDDAAWAHWRKAVGKHPAVKFPGREQNDLPRIIVLVAPCGGNAPIMRLLDKKTFVALELIPDFYDAAAPLPRYDLILNAIGDADHCPTSLDAAGRLLEHNTRPLLNAPDRVRPTGRADNARLLGTLEGVVTPRIVTLDREILAGSSAGSVLEEHGLNFPLLLRAPGFHGGAHFVRVEDAGGLAPAVSGLPGKTLMAIQYLETQDGDGKVRKFRVMMIDGKLYPLHKAVSQHWMIHYFSAEMSHSAEHRAEDEAFLEEMPAVLGERAMGALEKIREAMRLDYAGIDFSLGREGEVLLFETNATMVVPGVPKDEKWNYRRRPVDRIGDAVREMIRSRVSGGNQCIDNAGS
jgi:tetratricopeptide (TPR) repeat protein